jgi:hypothetical protein
MSRVQLCGHDMNVLQKGGASSMQTLATNTTQQSTSQPHGIMSNACNSITDAPKSISHLVLSCSN